MKGVRHYTKQGKTWKGSMHKMKNGDLHSGKTHTKSSQKLYHFGELSKKAKVNAKKSWRKNSIAPSMKKLGKIDCNLPGQKENGRCVVDCLFNNIIYLTQLPPLPRV